MNKELQKRVLEISYERKLSHIGSCLGVVEVLEEVDKVKKPEDIIVLDAAHGAVGYYVYLEKKGIANAEGLFEKHGVHQNRDIENQIWVSGGSLGLAASIGLGMAIANKERDVYVVTSDGAMMEGIWFEILRIKADKKVDNLRIYCNANGWGAYDPIDVDELERRVHTFCSDVVFVRTEVEGQQDHYKILTKEEYERAITDK